MLWLNKRRWVIRQKVQKGAIHSSVDIFGRSDVFSLIKAGEKLWLDREVSLYVDGSREDASIRFGDRVYVGRNTNIAAYCRVTIGSDVLIAPYCHINSCNHRFDRRDIPISQQGLVPAPILIGDGAWIGTHVVILAGVTIGEGAIIAAGAVVNKDVPAYEIWGGVPARFLKKRP